MTDQFLYFILLFFSILLVKLSKQVLFSYFDQYDIFFFFKYSSSSVLSLLRIQNESMTDHFRTRKKKAETNTRYFTVPICSSFLYIVQVKGVDKFQKHEKKDEYIFTKDKTFLQFYNEILNSKRINYN